MEIEPGAWIMHGGVARSADRRRRRRSRPRAWQRAQSAAGRTVMPCKRAAIASRPGAAAGHHIGPTGTSLGFRNVGCLPDWIEEESVFTAPPDAVHAVVFATGHGRKVEVRGVSFARLVAP
jgi:hypothetical protein